VITGHVDCPRCGDNVKYQADLTVGNVARRPDVLEVEISAGNIQFDHRCPAA